MTGYLCRNTRVARFFVGKEMHMNYKKLSGSIRAVIDRRPGDNGAYSDLFFSVPRVGNRGFLGSGQGKQGSADVLRSSGGAYQRQHKDGKTEK